MAFSPEIETIARPTDAREYGTQASGIPSALRQLRPDTNESVWVPSEEKKALSSALSHLKNKEGMRFMVADFKKGEEAGKRIWRLSDRKDNSGV